MARVETYSNQVDRAPPAATRLQAADFSTNIGPGLQEGARALREAAQTQLVKAEQARELGRTQYTADFFRLQGDLQSHILDLRDNAADGAAGHAESTRAAITEATEPFVAGIHDPILKAEMRARVAALTTTLTTSEAAWADQQRQISLGRNADQALDRAANGLMTDPTPENLEQSRQALAGMVDGWSNAPESLRIEHHQRIAQGTAAAYVTGIGRNNPGAALATLRSGVFDGDLSPEQRRTLETTMDAAQRQRVAAARAQAQSTIDVLQARLRNHDPTITDDELNQAQQLAQQAGIGTEAYNIAVARVMHRADVQYRNANPVEISTAINEVSARIATAGEHASPDDVVLRDHLQTLLTQRTQIVQNDPLSAAARAGVRIPPLNFSDPASIQARIVAARAAQRLTGFYQVLTPQETALLRERAASGPAGRLSAVNALAAIGAADQEGAMDAARQIAPDDPTFVHAMRLPPNARELVIRGAEARRLMPAQVRIAQNSELSDVASASGTISFNEATQVWFVRHVAPMLVRSQPEFINGVLEGARNIYAERRRALGDTGQEEFSEANFASSVNLALGRSQRGGGMGQWTQGPRAANGDAPGFLLPARMSQQGFESVMANLPIEGDPRHHSWMGASNGVPVWSNGAPVSTDDIRGRFVPVAVSDGVYQFQNGPTLLMTREGRPFQLDVYRAQAAWPPMGHVIPRAPTSGMFPERPVQTLAGDTVRRRGR